LGVATLVFLFLHLIPGDPVEVMLGETAMAADKEALRRALGLDRPWWRQYVGYLAGLARADLGMSLQSGEPVLRLILERYPATMELALGGVAVAVVSALPLGVLSARRPRSGVDYLSMTFSLVGVSMPNFWLGPLLILLFSIKLGWLPVSGRGGPAHLIQPALTLGMSMAAILTRMTRAAVLEQLHEDYVRTARAKGLGEGRVLARHALRNALTVIVTLVGLQFGALLAGTIITETIFSWPGLGRLLLQAIHTRDYPLVQGCVLAIALSYVVVNLLTDLAYAVIDPRVSYR
jgi:peptide/nickel transport system permease protein